MDFVNLFRCVVYLVLRPSCYGMFYGICCVVFCSFRGMWLVLCWVVLVGRG